VYAPPEAHAARALSVSQPSPEDYWLAIVTDEAGGLHSLDLRAPGAPLAALARVHAGPAWRSCAGGAGGELLLSCGEDGAVRATPLAVLRGVVSQAALPPPPLLQAAQPLRRLDAWRGGLVVAGDDAGRLHAADTAAALKSPRQVM